MNVGDLIKEREYPEMGLIIEVKRIDDDEPYGVLTPTGKILWFSRRYVEKMCEVISEKK